MAFKEVRAVVEALRNVETYTTVLMAIVIEQYGTEALHWTPETIFLELHQDFGVELPKQNKDQIVVGLNILTSDDFYKRLPFFIQACNVLAGSELVDYFDKADASECAWGVTEVALLWPAEDEDREPFAPEILHYLGHVLDEEGIVQPPAILCNALRSRPPVTDRIETSDLEELSAAFQIRTDRTQMLEETLQENLSALLHQLAALPGMKERVDELVADLRQAN